jgi:hypothetical protein
VTYSSIYKDLLDNYFSVSEQVQRDINLLNEAHTQLQLGLEALKKIQDDFVKRDAVLLRPFTDTSKETLADRLGETQD